jgi:hypothetical protein
VAVLSGLQGVAKICCRACCCISHRTACHRSGSKVTYKAKPYAQMMGSRSGRLALAQRGASSVAGTIREIHSGPLLSQVAPAIWRAGSMQLRG